MTAIVWSGTDARALSGRLNGSGSFTFHEVRCVALQAGRNLDRFAFGRFADADFLRHRVRIADAGRTCHHDGSDRKNRLARSRPVCSLDLRINIGNVDRRRQAVMHGRHSKNKPAIRFHKRFRAAFSGDGYRKNYRHIRRRKDGCLYVACLGCSHGPSLREPLVAVFFEQTPQLIRRRDLERMENCFYQKVQIFFIR